jgi:hypothetical protein
MNTVEYSLLVGDVELVLQVDFFRSIESTHQFRADHGDDYAFVVACVGARLNGGLIVVQTEWDVYNLIVWLGTLEVGLSNPVKIAFDQGSSVNSVSDWLDQYWVRVSDETEGKEDESRYDLISKSLLTIDSKSGHIAAYLLGGYAYIEVLGHADGKRHVQKSTFDTLEIIQRVSSVREKIKGDLLRRLVTSH